MNDTGLLNLEERTELGNQKPIYLFAGLLACFEGLSSGFPGNSSGIEAETRGCMGRKVAGKCLSHLLEMGQRMREGCSRWSARVGCKPGDWNWKREWGNEDLLLAYLLPWLAQLVGSQRMPDGFGGWDKGTIHILYINKAKIN